MPILFYGFVCASIGLLLDTPAPADQRILAVSLHTSTNVSQYALNGKSVT